MWSLVCVWFSWRLDLTWNNVAWFLMTDFLRLSPAQAQNFLVCFVDHCESCAQDVNTVFWWLGFYGCGCHLEREYEKTVAALCIFFLIIVKFLQLRGHRQIAEPRKYCLVHVIVFFGMCFLYFCFSYVGNFGLIPYNILV